MRYPTGSAGVGSTRPHRRSPLSVVAVGAALVIGLATGYFLCRLTPVPARDSSTLRRPRSTPQESASSVVAADEVAPSTLLPAPPTLTEPLTASRDRIIFAQMPHDDAAGSGIVPYVRQRVNGQGQLLLIPVNAAYVDFGLNLMCSLRNISRQNDLLGGGGGGAAFYEGPQAKGFAFVALDTEALSELRSMKLPVFRDPNVPFVSSKSAAWADPKFHMLVCTKLLPSIRLLKAGIPILLADADIVFLRDITPYLRSDVDVTFSIGSCHRDLPDNFKFLAEGIEKLNTGFYYAKPTPGVISLLERAHDRCRSTSMSGDQPAMNAVILEDQAPSKKKSAPGGDVGYTYAFFDGCQVANGCVFFKHLCENATYAPSAAAQHRPGGVRRSEPAVVHANFLVGRKDKIKHLRKFGLWDEACINQWRTNGG